ncbi:MAG: hypothetical protein USCAAHI_00068 [Beijerinckiaceae bacterium]|nr:MAG: hypothetical protein USCAAHI_00068 [Beijerinckiaceae bacterium]
MLPSVRPTTSAPETFKLSRLHNWPMRSPADASSSSSRMPTHASGPMRFAIPSLRRTFTTYSLPVSPAHRSARILHHLLRGRKSGAFERGRRSDAKTTKTSEFCRSGSHKFTRIGAAAAKLRSDLQRLRKRGRLANRRVFSGASLGLSIGEVRTDSSKPGKLGGELLGNHL